MYEIIVIATNQPSKLAKEVLTGELIFFPESINNGALFETLNVYILSFDKIPYEPNGGTEGKFFCLGETEHGEKECMVNNVGNCGGCRKILFTTNKELNLPSISDDFLKEFIKTV